MEFNTVSASPAFTGSSAQHNSVKKSNALRNGSLIGVSIATAEIGRELCSFARTAKINKKSFLEVVSASNASIGGKKGYLAVAFATVGLLTGIGAGIGKLVQNHKKAKEDIKAA